MFYLETTFILMIIKVRCCYCKSIHFLHFSWWFRRILRSLFYNYNGIRLISYIGLTGIGFDLFLFFVFFLHFFGFFFLFFFLHFFEFFLFFGFFVFFLRFEGENDGFLLSNGVGFSDGLYEREDDVFLLGT